MRFIIKRKRAGWFVISLLCAFFLTGCGDAEVNQVSADIKKVGTVTLESEQTLSSIREEYNALTEEQKKKVNNYSDLEADEAELERLKEEKCIADIKEGYQARQDNLFDHTTSDEEYKDNVIESIDLELNAVKKYADENYSNIDFKNEIKEYIAALQNQVIGMEAYPTNPQTYNDDFLTKGFLVRAECLKTFNNDYGLSVDVAYKDYFNESTNTSGLRNLIATNEWFDETSDFGDAEFNIEGIEENDTWTQYAKEDGGISDGKKLVLLKIIVSNEGYLNSSDYYMDVEDFFSFTGEDRFTIPAYSSSWEYGGYESGAGGFFQIRQGETKKVVVPYAVDADASAFHVFFNNHEVYVILDSVDSDEDEAVPQDYKNALVQAKSYSNALHMSKQGVYNQLISETVGFQIDAAQYAIDHVSADWKENALLKGREYYTELSMSKSGVYNQLISEAEQFTEEEAQYAIEHLDD